MKSRHDTLIYSTERVTRAACGPRKGESRKGEISRQSGKSPDVKRETGVDQMAALALSGDMLWAALWKG